MLIRPHAVACALALSTCVAHALAADPTLDTALNPAPNPAPNPALNSDADLPKVVVAGARHDQRRDDTAASIVVGRAELLRHGDRSLGDALKRVAGVTVGPANGQGSGLRLRGLGQGYTQILLDGVAVPNGFSLESLAPELIERIEIVRGASAQLGTQSIAGTINIVLRKAAAKADPTRKLGLDRQRGTYAASASAETGGMGEHVRYALPVTVARSRVGTRQLAREQAPGVHRLSHQQEMNAATSLTLAPRANWTREGGDKLDLRALLSATRRTLDMVASETAFDGMLSRYPQRASVFTLSQFALRADAAWSRKLEGGARVEARAGTDATERRSDFVFDALRDGLRGPGVHFVQADSREASVHAGASHASAPRLGHTLSAGWDASRSARVQQRLGRDLDVPGIALSERDERYDGSIARMALFVQDSWEIDGAWSLAAGWRGEVLTTTVRQRAAAQVRQRSVIGSPLLQVLYKDGSQGQLRAGLARTYKAPTMVSLIPRRFVIDNNNSATNPDIEGNPALRPEKAWGLDAGYDYYPARDSLLSVSAYVRSIDDVTLDRLYLDGASWVRTPANQGRATTRGLALEARLVLPRMPTLALHANLARNWSQVERIAGPDNRLDEQVPLSANAGIEYRGLLKAGASLAYTRGASTRMSDVWTTRSGATRALDMYVLWEPRPGMRLRLAAANLLGRGTVSGSRYEDTDGPRQTALSISSGALVRLTLELDANP